MPPNEPSAQALARGVLVLGVHRLPWTKALRQWRDRVMFLRRAEGEPWPDLSDERLGQDPEWLAPFLIGKTRLDEIGAHDLSQALNTLLPWDLARRLDEEAPTSFLAPTGTAAPIDYEAEGGPAIALRVQELFGLAEHPSVAGHPADAPSALAGASADPDHSRPAGFLARLLGRRPVRAARPLSAPLLAGGSGEGCADDAGEAAGNLSAKP